MLAINDFMDYFRKVWDNSSSSFPTFEKTYSDIEKKQREAHYTSFQKRINDYKSARKARQIYNESGKDLFPVIEAFLETIFDFEKEQIDIILSDDFKDVSKDFFIKAREFDQNLKPEDIYQGLRNVWIMNGIQLMAQFKVGITPSVFAYSLIYPYSDNFLDHPDITTQEKQLFSERFSQRLHGISVVPKSDIEHQLYKLVTYFENEFSRDNFPKVYESLYAIHKAQTDSLKLLKADDLSNAQIQTICFEKGGTSVLADGYLVTGNLTHQQEQALFGYGIYLQLLDDIQDLKEDKEADTKTMFSNLTQTDLGAYINKTIHFGRAVLDEMRCFNEPYNDSFFLLMKQSIEMMIIESVGLNNSWYSDSYINIMEKHSPLNYTFLRHKRSESKSSRYSVFQKYFSTQR